MLSIACEGAIVAFTYVLMLMHVSRNQEIRKSIQQALSQYGLDSPLYTLITVFFAYSILVLALSFIVRKLFTRHQASEFAGRTPHYYQDRVVSRYDLGVTVSSILIFLIPAAGLPLIILTGGANEALLAAVVMWGLGLVLTAPRKREFIELVAQSNEGVAPAHSLESPIPEREFSCTGMRLGWVRSHGGSLLVRPEGLLIRSVFGLLGEYWLPAEQVLAFHVESSNWLTGLKVRIEHGARDAPAAIILVFDSERDVFFQELASTGFVPLASPSQVIPNRGLPVRVSALVALIVLWNCLILAGIIVHWSFLSAAMLLLFAASILMGTWPSLATYVMKPGRDIGEIRPFLGLTRNFSAILLAIAVLGLLGRML